MGFRNPITSAVAVDTGAAAPGVKVYATSTNPGAGVVEWDAYTAFVKAALTSSETGSGGSYFDVTLDGTAVGLGPALGLHVEAQQDGGYKGVAKISGAAVADLGGADVVNLSGSGWLPLQLATGFAVAGDCALFRRAGWAAVVVTVLASGGWAANTPLLSVPLSAGVRPQKTAWVVGNISGVNAFALTRFDPNGQITIVPAVTGSNDFRVAYTFPTA